MLARLVAASDVLVENFRPGVLAQMGFDAARLKALKPDLGLRHYQRLRHDRTLSRPPRLRLHRPGDERLHGGDRRRRRAALARRAAESWLQGQ